MCHFGQAYLSCGKKQEHASLPPSFLRSSPSCSHFSLKREARRGRWYNSNRSSKSHDCRRKEGGSDCIAFIIIQFPSLPCVALSVARKLLSKEKRGTREASLSHTRVVPRQRDWKEARDGRARYLPETKANRSISRSAFLFEGEQSFSDMKVTVY